MNKDRILDIWKDIGTKYPDEEVSLSYVPLKKLLDPEVQKNFPDIVIFNMVKGVHTTATDPPVMVSHQGFIIKKNGVLYLRHAAINKEVMEVPLNDYIEERMKDKKWPTLGFNFQAIHDPW